LVDPRSINNDARQPARKVTGLSARSITAMDKLSATQQIEMKDTLLAIARNLDQIAIEMKLERELLERTLSNKPS
jgi:hypothetical protein